MEKKRKVELTLREVYACWTAVCSGSSNHQRKIYTQILKEKLFKLMSEDERRKMRKDYDI